MISSEFLPIFHKNTNREIVPHTEKKDVTDIKFGNRKCGVCSMQGKSIIF